MMKSLLFAVFVFFQAQAPSGRSAVISGQVVSAEGVPAAGIRVSAQEVNPAPGQSTLISLTETDDMGRYRLIDLPAGSYHILAGSVTTPTYFPGVVDRSFAQAVTVTAGARLESVDFPIAVLPPLIASDRRARQGPCTDASATQSPVVNALVIAADRTGNVFFAEAYSSLVKKIIPDGKVQVVAGNGSAGHSGDGGPATAATLGPVNVLAVDPAGNLFIAEASFGLLSRSSVRERVNPAGTIMTIAGNGADNGVEEGIPAVSASLRLQKRPGYELGSGIAADGAGNVYVAEGEGSRAGEAASLVRRIRKVRSDGTISTIFEQTTRAVKVSGQIVSAVPPESYAQRGFSGAAEPAAPIATLYLVHKEFRSSPVTASMNAPTSGRFEISGIWPGEYDLFVSLPDIQGWGIVGSYGASPRPLAFGRVSLTVKDNLTDVTVNVHPGVDLDGRLLIDGRPSETGGIAVRLQPEPDPQAAMGGIYTAIARYTPAIAPDGTFKFPALPEARYGIVIEGPGVANLEIEDIVLDGKSVKDSGVAVGASSPGKLEIRLRTAPQ